MCKHALGAVSPFEIRIGEKSINNPVDAGAAHKIGLLAHRDQSLVHALTTAVFSTLQKHRGPPNATRTHDNGSYFLVSVIFSNLRHNEVLFRCSTVIC